MKTRSLGKTGLKFLSSAFAAGRSGSLFGGSIDVKDAPCLLKPPTTSSSTPANGPMSTAVVQDQPARIRCSELLWPFGFATGHRAKGRVAHGHGLGAEARRDRIGLFPFQYVEKIHHRPGPAVPADDLALRVF